MPIIYTGGFAQGAGAAAREFKDVNKSVRDTMFKLEGMRRQEEENEARRAQQYQMQQERLQQQQKQFDVQMDFKQQAFASEKSRVGDTFGPVSGAGMLSTLEDMTALTTSANEAGRTLMSPEQESAFGAQVAGLLGRTVTADAPITPEELDNHPNRRELYRLITGQYNRLATQNAQQQLMDTYEGGAQSLVTAHPEFAQTPAGLALLDEMSAGYADALQEDVLNPRAAGAEMEALRRAFIAGATRMEDISDTKAEVFKLMQEKGNVRASQRELVNDILAKLDNPKFAGPVNDVRLEALRVIDPDAAEQYEQGRTSAALDVTAAAIAGTARQQASPPDTAPAPLSGAPTSATQSAGAGTRPPMVLPPGSAAAQVLNGLTDNQRGLIQFLTNNGVEVPFDAEEGQFTIPRTPLAHKLRKQYVAQTRPEQAIAKRYEQQRAQEEAELQAMTPDERDRVIAERSLAQIEAEKEEREAVRNEMSRSLGRVPRDYEVDEEMERRRTPYKAGDRSARTPRVRRALDRTLAVDPTEEFTAVPIGPGESQPESTSPPMLVDEQGRRMTYPLGAFDRDPRATVYSAAGNYTPQKPYRAPADGNYDAPEPQYDPIAPPGVDEARKRELVARAAQAEQQILQGTRADQDRRRELAQAQQDQAAMEQLLQDIAPGSRELARMLMRNRIPFDLDENGHVIVTDELKEAFMQDDVR